MIDTEKTARPRDWRLTVSGARETEIRDYYYFPPNIFEFNLAAVFMGCSNTVPTDQWSFFTRLLSWEVEGCPPHGADVVSGTRWHFVAVAG